MESNYQKLWLYTLDGGGPEFSPIYIAVLVLTMRVWLGSLTRAVVKVGRTVSLSGSSSKAVFIIIIVIVIKYDGTIAIITVILVVTYDETIAIFT